MALESGTNFGSYEIVEQIGAGGMGEVWRATDPGLSRDVALKVLPSAFVEDADRLNRFQREAEILASLNHPNIAQVYGLEKADGQTAIVMELVEGPTLADRIAEGPIPPDEAMGIALQVVAALEAAHDKGIVHRDLKPANVMIKDDGTVRVLDFGISKPIDATAISGGGIAATPAVTQTGVILGTAAYMSPEQARGKFVDQRTDIWAFGCLLFEMLTGQPAFAGEDIMAILARVIDRDTDLSSMPGSISPAVRHTIRLCLEKDPKRRIADIRDVRLALEGTFETELPRSLQTAVAQPIWRRALPIAAAIVLAAGAWYLKPAPPSVPDHVARFDYPLPAGSNWFLNLSSVDIAPDGSFFIFDAIDAMYVRQLDDITARPIPNPDGGLGLTPAIAPSNREFARFERIDASGSGFRLVKIPINGGAAILLAAPLGFPYGLSWEANGMLLFGQSDGIWQVPEGGGTPSQLIETGEGEQAYGPQLLPGGDWILYALARSSGADRWNEAEIVIESLTADERHVLVQGGSDPHYLPTGHITYMFQDTLYASAFDISTLAIGAERVPVVQGVQEAAAVLPEAANTFTGASGGAGGGGQYAVADNGSLVYVPGGRAERNEVTDVQSPFGVNAKRSLVWADRDGAEQRLDVRADAYVQVRISPDGRYAAVVVGSVAQVTADPPDSDGPLYPADIYIVDLQTENLSQLTFHPSRDDSPVWSPDSSRIYFRSWRSYAEDGVASVYSKPAAGGDAELVYTSSVGEVPMPWSMPNDQTLLLLDGEAASINDTDIAVLDLAQNEPTFLLDDDAFLMAPSLSPDGAYMLHWEAGEINLRPYPNVRARRHLVAQGMNPVFSSQGTEIFFLVPYRRTDADPGIYSVSVQYEPLDFGEPRKLFGGPPAYWYGVGGPLGNQGRAWDVDPVNDRFLMISMPEDLESGRPRFAGSEAESSDEDPGAEPRIAVVLNWFSELRERVRP